MNITTLAKEIIATYQKHGWQLRHVLMRAESRASMATSDATFAGLEIEESEIDGLWFSRASHNQREAWELRLLAETPYALFETFEIDETEEQREEMRREMEARMRDYAGGKAERGQ